MKSIFNFRVFLIPTLIFLSFALGLVSLIDVLIKNKIENNEKQIILSILFIYVFTIIFIHEIKTKIIIISIEENKILKKTWGTKDIFYDFKDINGFQTRTVKGKLESFEYLYLIKDNKRVLTISQTYHKNYFELKNKISKDFNNLGVSKFGLFDEIIEILTLNYI